MAQALSGFLSVVVDPERPRFLGPALADAITGIYAAFGILGALLERAGTGQGRLVEVSMFEAMAHFAVEPFAAYFALGEVAEVERPAAPRAGLHPAHRGRAPARDPPLLAREVLDGPHDRARGAGARRRPALQRTPPADPELRGARRGARRALPQAPARRMGGAPFGQRRAVCADQWHRRGRERSAGAPPRPRRPGRGGRRGRPRSGAPGAAVRRPARDVGDRGAAPQPARRRDPRRARTGAAAGRPPRQPAARRAAG